MAGIDDVPDYAVNISYTMACTWMAIAALPTTCSGGYTPSFPTSNNLEPNYDSMGEAPVVMSEGVQIDNCGLHAICTSCMSETGELNKYCAAVAGFYMRGKNSSMVDTNVAKVVLNDQAFWCLEDTIQRIEDGTFNKACDLTKAENEPGHC
jgi:hypothetical protein